ncbi:hypothetical protein Ocin01_09186 [Orchesella cincta]|uniref:Uncharacterized protein n=1 Tax=Orchesella cincta TaxID=48709 RepID=A0A1D2MXI1_ORCCI|nr:hypothetical protein Ocin01_09186 [Orchesella cincta]
MWDSRLLLLNLPAIFLLTWEVRGEVEICTDGGTHVFQITHDTCPFGFVFLEPQTADCVDPYDGDLKKQFQVFPALSTDPIEPGNSCKTIMSSMCTMPIQKVSAHFFRQRPDASDFAIADELQDKNYGGMKDQTMRLFEYMFDLGNQEMDESLRVVQLLKQTYRIFKKFCDPAFVKTEFYEDVEKAFIFLLNEADSTRVKDISFEEYKIIHSHLQQCEDQRNPLKFEGRRCATYSLIQRVNKSGEVFTRFHEGNKEAFTKYDVPVEATWGAIDFVHGLCYGTFRDHINSHHLYQQALERIFTNEILFRWKSRFVLTEQHVWNNFFSANVKNALINMDICIQASYLSTPFLHRLERPIEQEDDRKAAKGRKKRWAEVQSLTSFGDIDGYCFQTADEASKTIQNLTNSCPKV